MRGRAVAARRAHNPEVAGSSPVPATRKNVLKRAFFAFKRHKTSIKTVFLSRKSDISDFLKKTP